MDQRLEPSDLATLEVAGDAQISPGGEAVAYCLGRMDLEHDRELSQLHLAAVGRSSGPPVDLEIEGRSPRWSPDGSSIALLRDRGETVELLRVTVADRRARMVASLGGDVGPAAWSPDGKRIAFVIADPPGSESRIAVLDAENGSVGLLPGGEWDDSAPSWSPDGTRLAFARAERDLGERGPASRIVVASIAGDQAVSELQCDLAFATSPSWSPDGQLLACYGTREARMGFDDPALQPWILPAGGGKAGLAAEDVQGVITPYSGVGPAWSGDGSSILFREARRGDINLVGARVEEPGRPIAFTSDCQVADFSASRNGDRLALSITTTSDPGSVSVWEQGAEPRKLTVATAAPLPRAERRRFQSPHGYGLDGWVQGLGAGPEPRPLLVCMHGGPHNFVGPSFSLGHFHRNVLASRGWIVLALNCSGSGSYGAEFADSIRGRWGEHDLPEYMAAVDALVEDGLADPDRLAVAGYSYGGYLAAWAISHTDRFKAAVVGAPITNLESFYSSSDIGRWYASWEMDGGLAENRERFKELSPVNHAGRIATPTLLLHGEEDDRCPIGQSEELRERIAAAGRAPVELVRYPGAGHLFYSRGRPSQRIDYNRRAVEWVEAHVLGVGKSAPKRERISVGAAGMGEG